MLLPDLYKIHTGLSPAVVAVLLAVAVTASWIRPRPAITGSAETARPTRWVRCWPRRGHQGCDHDGADAVTGVGLDHQPIDKRLTAYRPAGAARCPSGAVSGTTPTSPSRPSPPFSERHLLMRSYTRWTSVLLALGVVVAVSGCSTNSGAGTATTVRSAPPGHRCRLEPCRRSGRRCHHREDRLAGRAHGDGKCGGRDAEDRAEGNPKPPGIGGGVVRMLPVQPPRVRRGRCLAAFRIRRARILTRARPRPLRDGVVTAPSRSCRDPAPRREDSARKPVHRGTAAVSTTITIRSQTARAANGIT
jgi:hypothetical protein